MDNIRKGVPSVSNKEKKKFFMCVMKGGNLKISEEKLHLG